MKRQLFILSAETIRALKSDELEATEMALRECGAYALPYPEVDIWLPANEVFGWNSATIRSEYGPGIETDVRRGLYKIKPDGQVTPVIGSGFVFEFNRISLDHLDYSISMHVESGSPASQFYRADRATPPTYNTPALVPRTRDQICQALIVLLATRNAVKAVQRDKLAALGCAKHKHRHEYITTITLPQERDRETEGAPGALKRPHLRRGHVRRQHHGPHNELVKMIFIPPVFVNADKDWVESRHHYNVSL